MDSRTINERIERYAKWRKDNNWPQFEPADGICFNCRRQIFDVYDGTKAITGCPHCHRTFVD